MSVRDDAPGGFFDGRRNLLPPIVGVAMLVGLLLAFQGYLEQRRVGRDPPFERVVLEVMPYWLFWAALAPIVLWATDSMVARNRGSARSRVATQLIIAAALMLSHSAALYVWQRTFSLTDLYIPVWKAAIAIARWRFPTNLLVYGILVGLVYARESARRTAEAHRVAHERELFASRLSEQLATARLQSLRMQLNPHFLFNALNTVSMLVRGGDAPKAVRVVTGLSELLRQLLTDPSSPEVTLEEELGFVKRYLAIEQARFGDGLRITLDVAPETLQARVPSLILQPIVENAVRHGATEAGTSGFVRVTSSRRGASLVLEVADNGPGVPDDDERSHSGNGAGLGIKNTVERLTHLHGDRFDFELRNAATGAVATIVLPFSTQPAPRLAR